MSDKHFDFSIKLILVGDVSVGKTSLLNNFLNEENPTNTISTIGTEHHSYIY